MSRGMARKGTARHSAAFSDGPCGAGDDSFKVRCVDSDYTTGHLAVSSFIFAPNFLRQRLNTQAHLTAASYSGNELSRTPPLYSMNAVRTNDCTCTSPMASNFLMRIQ